MARIGGIGALTAACVIAYALDWESPIRTVLGGTFILLAPGLAVTEALRLSGVAMRLAIAPATSLALGTLVGTSLLYAGIYTPASTLYTLAILTFGLIALSAAGHKAKSTHPVTGWSAVRRLFTGYGRPIPGGPKATAAASMPTELSASSSRSIASRPPASHPATSRRAPQERAAPRRDGRQPGARAPVARRRQSVNARLPTATAARRATPPDPRRAWTACIQWAQAAETGRFTVLARADDDRESTLIADSAPLEWPPSDPTIVDALGAAVTELERALLGAGWTSLSAGDAWYAKRFAWRPRSSSPSPPAAQRKPDGGRLRGRTPWPEASNQLWRCELRWILGEDSPRFEAAAYEPGKSRGRPVGGRGIFTVDTADAEPSATAYSAEVLRLVAALEGVGWEHIGRGAGRISARLIWRGAGTPPDVADAGDARPVDRPGDLR